MEGSGESLGKGIAGGCNWFSVLVEEGARFIVSTLRPAAAAGVLLLVLVDPGKDAGLLVGVALSPEAEPEEEWDSSASAKSNTGARFALPVVDDNDEKLPDVRTRRGIPASGENAAVLACC